jgi:hypothetical protein
MPSAFDEAIKVKFLEYLEREMSFISRHPLNAHNSYDAAASIISSLERFELITEQEALGLYGDLEAALAIAVAARPRRR